ncbi:HAMP domain-containing histidine kinase [Ornithinibacillus gellani]|uniref:sensor histidine kinase n=1 Tax=Ornithinibacillus gellani TaxID=2293253 RepID=UPI000F47DA7A|nr:HAMP domain-containing sensor histidine kinase [Ornithinibacillus gellani]TQS71827.1 HAMP domain-containing histidine kinase [Ornithinibacillus gellani]
MKWKLTARYLLSILSIVFIVTIVNTILLFGLFIYQSYQNTDHSESSSSEAFARTFKNYLTLLDDSPHVTAEGKKALDEFGAWLQILDANGHVISSYQTPKNVATNYTPFELVHKYKYMDDDLNTYFIGEYEGYSYLIGVPNSNETREVFMLNPSKLVKNASQYLVVIIIVDLMIAVIIGFLFSTILTKPVNRMIERINELKEHRFHTEKPKRPGIYKRVFANLNNVSTTLQEHQTERMKLEKMRNDWISNVSHDIKTPLASIRGYAELLGNDNVTPLERLKYAEVIERQSLYMKELLDDFNLTMRLRNQEMPLQRQETNMEDFVREIVIDLLNDPQFRSSQIHFESENSELNWNIDQHLMKRALLNFIYNAFIHNDERVEVFVYILDDAIVIQDNGKGISPEEQDQVFDRYYRGTNTEHIRGTGLGMAISRDIIEAHGGKIKLTSQVGKGTTIKIKLEQVLK